MSVTFNDALVEILTDAFENSDLPTRQEYRDRFLMFSVEQFQSVQSLLDIERRLSTNRDDLSDGTKQVVFVIERGENIRGLFGTLFEDEPDFMGRVSENANFIEVYSDVPFPDSEFFDEDRYAGTVEIAVMSKTLRNVSMLSIDMQAFLNVQNLNSTPLAQVEIQGKEGFLLEQLDFLGGENIEQEDGVDAFGVKLTYDYTLITNG